MHDIYRTTFDADFIITQMKKNIRLIASVLIAFSFQVAFAQYKITGVVVDSKDGQPLPGATATIQADNGKPEGQSTDIDGKFTIRAAAGKYKFKVVFLGYRDYEKNITITDSDLKLGTIRLRPESKELQEVEAKGTLRRQEQRGDTTVFNADAYKVNPDATTEDLIKKMPGMQVSGSSVTAGGETVKKVLVDGKEFFGDDPMVALKNIQADMVSKIEVYDRQSDQSAFTGFSDGNEEKTINILTKMGMTKGAFGRVYGGYGTDSRYEMGGNYNIFNGDHRVSIIGMLNNINQQNFSFDDITGAMSNGGGRGMGGMFNMGQGGKNRTGSIGINYGYEKKDTLKIEFSYFYNNNKNVTNSTSMQEYFVDNEDDSLRIYTSGSESEGLNNNHRANLRLTWTIDENNSLIFTPRASWQKYENSSMSFGNDTYDSIPYLSTFQNSDQTTTGISASGDLMWRHKFSLPRRTLTVRVGSSVSNSDADGESNSSKEYNYTPAKNLFTAQRTDNASKRISTNGSITYTEPIGEYMAFQVNYSPTFTRSKGDKIVDADTVASLNTTTFDFEFSPTLSNKKTSDYLQQKGGIGLNIFKGKDFNANIGLDYQYATLEGNQTYPLSFETSKSFRSLLPSVMVRLRKDRALNLNFRYRASTSAPSISNLQQVVDVSNIRIYTAGNPNLVQSYTHDMRMFFAYNNAETSRAIFMMGGLTATNDYISTSSVIASVDSIIDNDIVLPAGTQFNKPVNMDGYLSARANITLSTPVSWLGSNVNLSMGGSFLTKPSLYNGRKVTSDTYNLNGGLTIGSSFSENFDFTLSYNGGYNIMKSTQTAESNYNYYNHTASADINLLFFTRLVLNSSVSHQMSSGMGKDYDYNYVMWNAGIGYKFLSDRRAELRLKLNDILDNNQSVSRSIQDAYVQTSTTDVLRRYAMLTFTYKFKTIGNMPRNDNMFMGPPPGMMRRR